MPEHVVACFKHATENHFIIISQQHYGKKKKKLWMHCLQSNCYMNCIYTSVFQQKVQHACSCFKQARGMLEACLNMFQAVILLLYSANGRIPLAHIVLMVASYDGLLEAGQHIIIITVIIVIMFKSRLSTIYVVFRELATWTGCLHTCFSKTNVNLL